MMVIAATFAASLANPQVHGGDDDGECWVDGDMDSTAEAEWDRAQKGKEPKRTATAASLSARAATERRKRQRKLEWERRTADTG